MKIGIVGGGIAGNTVAHHLHRDHQVTLFEANDYLGGHAHTQRIEVEGRELAVDTGFMVFNHRTYPMFSRLLDELGVPSLPTEMSFSVRCGASGLEYNGSDLGGLFSQRRNLARPGFYRMLLDILRFNREATEAAERLDDDLSLGAFLCRGRYSKRFVDHYIVPMGAAIWSSEPGAMLDFPARFFLRFMRNHGLLSINDRPTWRVVEGGASRYLAAMSAPYRQHIRLASPVTSVRRAANQVQVTLADGRSERFDHVFLACHSNQALAMLDDADDSEKRVLGAIPYQRNVAVLHTDPRMLPRRRRAWASWNYHLPETPGGQAGVTYHLGRLQHLPVNTPVLVTLNDVDRIDPKTVLATMSYDHPLFTVEGVRAQHCQQAINGVRNTWFCGAYWRNGFHEDGVASALAAVKGFSEYHGHAQQHLRRAG